MADFPVSQAGNVSNFTPVDTIAYEAESVFTYTRQRGGEYVKTRIEKRNKKFTVAPAYFRILA